MPEVERRRLEWRCRRGMKELDLLLLRYLRQRHAGATRDERATFEEFLELPDPDLARYLIGGDVPPDPRHAALCRAVLQTD
jgi:antitoxin CptB